MHKYEEIFPTIVAGHWRLRIEPVRCHDGENEGLCLRCGYPTERVKCSLPSPSIQCASLRNTDVFSSVYMQCMYSMVDTHISQSTSAASAETKTNTDEGRDMSVILLRFSARQVSTHDWLMRHAVGRILSMRTYPLAARLVQTISLAATGVWIYERHAQTRHRRNCKTCQYDV